MYKRSEIVDILRNHVAVVTFIKKDNTKREMFCTLNSSVLPDLEGNKTKRPINVLPVWDLEKDAWRSFRVDSVENLEIIE